jgi:sugar lactone lactonase YvrE
LRLSLDDITFVGRDLRRPECVLVEASGRIWTSDESAAVTRIDPDGAQVRMGAAGGVANGLALAPDGALIIADIALGQVRRLAADGAETVVLDGFEGRALGAVNFVCFDDLGDLWITVSTRVTPRSLAIERPIPDGYVLRLDGQEARSVADGLCFPNEIRVDRAAGWAYLAESALGRVVRMPIEADGGLGAPQPYGPAPLFEGAIVDGIAFDAEGGLWVTEVTRNGLHRITPDGRAERLLEDPSARVLNFPSSVAFGGPDLKTLYIGSLRMDRLASLPSPVAGAAMAHWAAPTV